MLEETLDKIAKEYANATIKAIIELHDTILEDHNILITLIEATIKSALEEYIDLKNEVD